VKKEVDIHKRDEENKCKMKEYSDNKNNAKYSGFNEGDCVLDKMPKTNLSGMMVIYEHVLVSD
jgi:hypothetical protein